MGQSTVTPDKQQGLMNYLSLHMRIVHSIYNKYPNWRNRRYVFIDTTAGAGYNQDVDEDGSPVIFQKCIDAHDLNYRAYFIDELYGNTDALHELFDDERVEIFTGDHRDIVPDILDTLRGDELGIVYMDKNGIPDFDLLADISKRHKKLDILVRCPATSIKRNRIAGNCKSLVSYLATIQKECKIVRAPLPSDKFQWVFFVFTNYAHCDWKKERFYLIESTNGKEILRRLNYTNEEIECIEQQKLFFNDEIRSRNDGICEMCYDRSATEIHHVKGGYATFDPSMRLSLCHKCHCQLEGMVS